MIPPNMIGFINNVALLICMGFVYDILPLGRTGEKSVWGQTVTGVILGVMGIAVMLTPWEFSPGVIFDTRSVLLCTTGLFFGTVPVMLTMLITGAHRLQVGGPGILTGIGVIVTSGAMGLAWRHLRKKDLGDLSFKEMYILGMIVHILMLAWMLTLPRPLIRDVLARISLPVMVIFPFGTAILGRIMSNRLANEQMRTRLKKSEQNYQSIYENAVEGFFQSTPQGRFISVNPSLARMFGYGSAKEMITMISDMATQVYVNATDRQRFVEQLQAKGHVKNFEFKARRKDGSQIWVSNSTRVVYDDKGRILRFEGSLTDITQRMDTERQIQNNADNLKAIFNSMPNILMLVNQEGKVEMINHRVMTHFGGEQNNTQGRLSGEVLNCLNAFDSKRCGHSPECVKCPVRSRVMDTFETGLPHSGEEGQMNFLIDNEKAPRMVLISTFLLEVNKTAKVLLSLTDITQKKLTQKRLRHNQARHRSILQTAMDGYWLTDSRGKLIEVNDTYCRMTGYGEHELLTMGIQDLVAPETEADAFARTRNIIKTGGDRYETRHRRKDGTLFDVEASVQYRKEEGQFVYFLRDLTERKRLEERIQQAQKMESIGNLAGGIAHDFNNILFPIVGMAEMLLEDLPPGSPEHENTRIILESGIRGSELVKQILAFSRQNEHKQIPIRVQQVVKEVLRLSRSTISTHIEISQNLQTDCGLVMADPTQVHQIAMNLITNAFHAVEETRGEIEVRVQEVTLLGHEWSDDPPRPGPYALLSVADNGCGISPGVMNKIFEPYFTTKKHGKGTGLGLTIVYGILKDHRGTIKIHSEPGKGTTVNVYLPLMNKMSPQAAEDTQEPARGGNERILLVDDEEPIVRLERQMFERLGYTVTVRTSSMDALGAFRSNPDGFDLVVTDMNMPNMTGAQLARELIALRPDIPIIITTGFSEKLDKTASKELGIKGFLMKPVVKSEMARVVRRVLNDTHPLRDTAP